MVRVVLETGSDSVERKNNSGLKVDEYLLAECVAQAVIGMDALLQSQDCSISFLQLVKEKLEWHSTMHAVKSVTPA